LLTAESERVNARASYLVQPELQLGVSRVFILGNRF